MTKTEGRVRQLEESLEAKKQEAEANCLTRDAVEKSIGELKSELAKQREVQREANLADHLLLGGLAAELKKSHSEITKTGQELRQKLEAQKVATAKGAKELGESLVEMKQALIGELRTLAGQMHERQDHLQQKNLAEMEILRTTFESRMSKNESNVQEVARYAGQIQDSVIAPSSYLIPAPFSWYAYLHKMLKIRKPGLIHKTATANSSPPRPGFWRRLERSIRKRRKRLQAWIGFDRKWYLQTYPDVAAAKIDPWWHYTNQGLKEGRFRNKSEQIKKKTGSDIPKTDGATRKRVINSQALEGITIPRDPIPSPSPISTDIRAIAFYLPQFHAIPENDEWWGKGFTEWTNVRRARPQYEGHYQPHVPHPDLGYYDLNDPEVMEKQAAMARSVGIEGFCYYYYWFNGRRLLNMPTDRMLATGRPDFPFCFCWANENWTRTWDGGDKEILIAQEHSTESDERFILDLLPVFRDPRYIRVDGKPLLVVYRPGILPDPSAAARHWRETCRREGIGEIFLARVQMFDWELEGRDPGYDTVIQFAPVSMPSSPNLRDSVRLHDPAKFMGVVCDYRFSAANYTSEPVGLKLWPGVCPSWDNTARRMERGHSWVHSTPETYHSWLSTAVQQARQTLPSQHRFVFINAWNEWGEGCHLEPDKKYGYAWLNATRFALTDRKPPEIPSRLRVLVVGHDAARAGAQILLLTMLREWEKRDDVDFRLILLSDGVLRSEFQKFSQMMVLTDHPTEDLRKKALENFCNFGPDVILANTVVSGSILPTLKRFGVPIVSYVHELQKSIERWAPGEIIKAAIANTDHFIAGAKAVGTNLSENHLINPTAISIQESFIETCKNISQTKRNQIRKELGLRPQDKVILGCGTMDWRKGPDIFAHTAKRVLENVPDARFVWIGPPATDEFGRAAHALAKEPFIRFIGEKKNFFDYFSIGSAYFLSSREDPYPLVALEAADAGLPIVCFAGAGGIPDFVNNTCGRTVPFEDIATAGKALIEILSNDPLRESLGRTARESVRAKHDASKGSEAVLAILKRLADGESPLPLLSGCPLVSVIVPNYNYASFLPERLDSILSQGPNLLEILVLDDASTDSSLQVIESYRRRFPDLIRVLPSSTNSGSPYPQWLRGIREAKGDLVWIAEADDSCEPDFLDALLPFFEDSSVGIAYCQSVGLDERSRVTRTDFLEHTEDLHPDRWKADYTELGIREAVDWMAYRNTIINASATLIRRAALQALGKELLSYRSCGDWFLYLSILLHWNVGYCARSLNKFRRHGRAVTRTTNQSEAYLREVASIRRFVSEAFPLHHSQIPRLDHFLDRDYAFDGIPRSSRHLKTRPLLEEAERNCQHRLRLAFISTNSAAHSGGSEVLWQRAALEARRRGHDVIALTKSWRPPPPFTAKFASAGIKHFETEYGGHDAIITFRPDLAIISTGNQDEGAREFELFSRYNIPFIIIHQLVKDYSVSPSVGAAHDDIIRKGTCNAQKVFFVSKNNHQIMERRLGCLITHGELFFNSLDISRDFSPPMPDLSRGFQLAFPARMLFIHKGQDILLQIMTFEKWRRRSVTINLFGHGEDEENIRNFIERNEIRNVRLCGFTRMEEIWTSNHAIVLASRMEGQSMAMLGAMVAGRVPIVTAVGGSAEVIKDNVTGFLAAQPTPEHLDEAMERAWQRRHEWPQIGRAARQSVLNLVPLDPIGDFVDRLQALSESKKRIPKEALTKIPQSPRENVTN